MPHGGDVAAQRTAQQQAVLAGQQATDQVLRQAQLSSYQYNQAMIQGAPAQMNYAVIKLRRTAAFEGQAKPPRATVLIPVVGTLALFKHGTDAVIPRGTPVDATVDTDTVLVASK
jgi:hypothetical protein